MREIDVDKQTVSDLFSNKRYSIDFYQREYRWGRREVSQLLDDLIDAFHSSWREDVSREAVEGFDRYFLGPVILTRRDATMDIVDGQQRLTTLLLLLMALKHRTDEIAPDQRETIQNLIVTTRMGRRTYTLAVDEREQAMDALYSGQEPDGTSPDLSVQNIIDRFADIEELVEDALVPQALPYFADWLLYCVDLVRVIARSDADAYTIFETMNDRGLRLTMPEMLRGYLLSRIDDELERDRAGVVWKQRIAELRDLGGEEDDDAIRTWLRSQHARSRSGYGAAVAPRDYERIGNEFHRWVRDVESKQLGLQISADFTRFVTADFAFYLRWYTRLRRASQASDSSCPVVYQIARQGFTLQYLLHLAALDISDSDDMALSKVAAVAAYVDILIHRRLWNSRRIAQTQMRYQVFDLAMKIRRKDLQEVVSLLTEDLAADEFAFRPSYQFRLNKTNKNVVRRFLARLTLHLYTGSGGAPTYADLLTTGRTGYDIEHILPETLSATRAGFSDKREFEDERNWIGGLLLVLRRDNASFGNKPFSKKRAGYLQQNLLAASLHPQKYEGNPAFRDFRTISELPFQSYDHFGKAELHERQDLYEQIAAQVWSPERIRREAGL